MRKLTESENLCVSAGITNVELIMGSGIVGGLGGAFVMGAQVSPSCGIYMHLAQGAAFAQGGIFGFTVGIGLATTIVLGQMAWEVLFPLIFCRPS